MIKLQQVLPILGSLVLISACANDLHRESDPKEALDHLMFGQNLSTASVGTAEGDYVCPAEHNILPEYDLFNDGSGRFTACTNKTSVFTIKLHGQTHTSPTVCIYPADYDDSTKIWIKKDSNGVPIHKCITSAGNGQGVVATFSGLDFNFLYVVEKQDELRMSACISSGNWGGCPAYSYGRFR